MKTQNITIFGLGRTGASIAMALKEGPLDFTLIGNDSDSNLLKQTLDAGTIDKSESNLVRAASPADIIVMATPASELEGIMRVIGSELQDHTLLIDLTPLKTPGIKIAEKYMTKGHYIGARPIFSADSFSDNISGMGSARADLFSNSVFCLMPGVNTDPQAVETAVNFGRLLGSSPYFVDPLEYDSLSQGVESLPGLTAAAIFASISKTKGWRDILRFADIPFAMATMPLDTGAEELSHLILNDKVSTLRWLDALSAEIQIIRRLVYNEEEEVLTALLDEMDENRAKWLHERSENNWFEMKETNIEVPGMGQRFLGGLANLGGGNR